MKWLLVVVGVLAGVVLVVAAVGASLPQNHVATRGLHLPASPERVWEVVNDVAKYPEWRSDVTSVELLSDDSAKLSWREISPKGNKLSFEATIRQEPSHLVSRITDTGIPFGGSWDYRIDPDGAGSRITVTEHGEVYNPVFRFVSKFVIGHTATIDKYLGNLSARVADTHVP